MDLEQALEKIKELETKNNELISSVDMLETEKSTLSEFKVRYEKDIQDLSKEQERLKQANMKYYEMINFENKPTQTETEVQTISMNDLLNQF